MGVKQDNIQNFFAQKKKETGTKRKQPAPSAKVSPSIDLTARGSSKASTVQAPQQQKAQQRWKATDDDVAILNRQEEATEKPRVAPSTKFASSEDNDDEMESALRLWDMDMRFGPCIGMTRLERWERAQKNGLSPPQHVHTFLVHAGAKPTCVWEDRV